MSDGLWGLVDTTGRVVVPLEYAALGLLSEGMVAAQKDGKWSFLSITKE